LTKSDNILDYTRNYYSELYSCDQTTIDDDEFFNFGRNKLNANENEILSGHISETECDEAIRNMKNNKSPGSDGISVEFYKLFCKDIKEFYNLDKLFVYNWPFNRTTNSKYNNIDTKKDKDTSNISNWRPISLLNIDYKIAAKVIANRILILL